MFCGEFELEDVFKVGVVLMINDNEVRWCQFYVYFYVGFYLEVCGKGGEVLFYLRKVREFKVLYYMWNVVDVYFVRFEVEDDQRKCVF